jgi:heat shock protein HslJ
MRMTYGFLQRNGRLLATLLLAGCATTGAAPTARPYHAHGTEPFWSVTIGGGRIVYEAPDQPGADVAAPRRRPIANGYRYLTPAMRIDVTHVRCNNGMGDRYYADTFQVYFPGADRPLDGCGGAVLPPATLADTGWGIVRIDGAAIAPAEDYLLQFDGEGRLHGQAGCNRLSGPYSEAGETLTPGPIMSTRMACPEPRMTHERKLLGLLSGPVRFSYPDGDILLLTGNGVTVRLRRN